MTDDYYDAINTKLQNQHRLADWENGTLQKDINQTERLIQKYADISGRRGEDIKEMRRDTETKRRLVETNEEYFEYQKSVAFLLQYVLFLIVVLALVFGLVPLGILFLRTAIWMNFAIVVAFIIYMIYLFYYNGQVLGERRAGEFTREYNNQAMHDYADQNLAGTPFDCPAGCTRV